MNKFFLGLLLSSLALVGVTVNYASAQVIPTLVSINSIASPAASLPTISGTSVGGDPSMINISLWDTTNDLYWDGTAWVPSSVHYFTPPTTLNNPNPGDWSFDVVADLGNPTFTTGNNYVIDANASDFSASAPSVDFVYGAILPTATSVTVSPATASILPGVTQQLTAVVLDQNGTPLATQPALDWTSSDPTIATVDANGLVTAIAVGPVTITAMDMVAMVGGSSDLTVTNSPVISASVTINPITSPATSLVTISGTSAGIDLTNPASTVQIVLWDATSANPLFWDGTAWVGTPNYFSPSIINSPNPGDWSYNVAVDLGNPTFIAGHDYQINAEGLDASQTVVFATPVTFTSGGVPTPVLTSIIVSPATASVGAGAMQTFTATALDQNGNPIATQPTFTWSSSDTAVATTDQMGMVTGVTAGTSVITAISGAVSGTAQLTVTTTTPTPVLTSIEISPVSATINVGVTQQLLAVALDQDGTPMATQPTLTWTSSNPAIATVDQMGMVTGVSAGSVVITAMDPVTMVGGSSSLIVSTPTNTATVTINPITSPMTSLATISGTSVGIDLTNPDATVKISLWDTTESQFWDGTAWADAPGYFTPSTLDPNTGDWSFNVVADLGNPNFVAGHNYQIDASGINATQSIINATPVTFTSGVSTPVLTSITVSPATASIVIGAMQTFIATGLDQNGNPMATQPSLIWISSNPTIATVDQMGMVTGVSAGTVTITAEDVNSMGMISGTATLTITAPIVVPILTSITVSPSAPSINVGAMQTFTATALDQNGNPIATQPTFTWTSSDTAVATVDQMGMVTGVSAGTVVISATSSTIVGTSSLTVTVIVVTPVLTSVTVSPVTTSLNVGSTTTIIASPLDQNGVAFVGATTTWSSSNPLIATVNASGLVAGVATGTVDIVATLTSGVTTLRATSTIAVVAVVPSVVPPVVPPVITTGSGSHGGGGGGSSYSQTPRSEEGKGRVLGASTFHFAHKFLRQGDRNDDVKALQNFLIKKATGPVSRNLGRVGATGYFGGLTRSALLEYQRKMKMGPYYGNLLSPRLSQFIASQIALND